MREVRRLPSGPGYEVPPGGQWRVYSHNARPPQLHDGSPADIERFRAAARIAVSRLKSGNFDHPTVTTEEAIGMLDEPDVRELLDIQ